MLWENRSRIEGRFFGAGPRGVFSVAGAIYVLVGGDVSSTGATKRADWRGCAGISFWGSLRRKAGNIAQLMTGH